VHEQTRSNSSRQAESEVRPQRRNKKASDKCSNGPNALALTANVEPKKPSTRKPARSSPAEQKSSSRKSKNRSEVKHVNTILTEREREREEQRGSERVREGVSE
jgi:hypothetical protein